MLASLKLQNWRSHHSTELILRRVNFMYGKPGSGKSSVPDAIVTLLIGKNRYTDQRGVGIKDDITVGKGFANITGLFLDEHGEIKPSREISHKASQRLSFADAPTNVDAAKDRLLTLLRANEEAVLALLNPKNILECDEAEQQKILIRLMWPPTIAVPEAVKAVGIETINSTQDIDAHIKRIKDVTVRELNREVEALEEAIRNAPAEVPDVTPLRTELASVQDVHRQAIEAQTKRSRYEKDLDDQRKSVQYLEGCRSNSVLRPMSEILANLDTLAESIKENDKLLVEVRGLKTKAQREYEEARQAGAATASQADLVTGMGSKCGVVGEFECPLTTRDKTRMKAMLAERAKKETAKAEEIRKTYESHLAREKELVEENMKIEVQQDELESEKRDAKKAQERDADLAAAQAELDKLVASPVEAGDPAEVGKLQDRVTEIQAAITNADNAKSAVAQRSIKVAQCDGKRQAIEMQKAAVDALLALKQDILKKGGAEFLTEMRTILDRFGLKDVEFNAAPYSLRVSGVSARRLSSGQKLVFDAALRVVASKATGFPMFAIDDSNRLDDVSRAAIQKLLGASGCQVFVCRTVDKPPASEAIAKLPDDCCVLWFESPNITGPTTVTVAR